ncbi:MAG: SURF1 family protein [Gammaproteobacteria bacterium]
MTRRFRPQLVPSAVLLVLLPVLASLGVWQLHRAEYKRALAAGFERAAQAAPLTLRAADLPALASPGHLYRRIRLRGRFDPALTVFLDNQMHSGAAGYAILSPLQVDGTDMRILVSRGWLAAGADRAFLPSVPPAGTDPVEVTGALREPYRIAIALGDVEEERFDHGALRTLGVDIDRLATHLGHPLASMVVESDARSPATLTPIPVVPPLDAPRHVAYAVQWFAIAAIAVAVYLAMSLKGGEEDTP